VEADFREDNDNFGDEDFEVETLGYMERILEDK
jgi:hypothetical protein